MTTDLKVMYGQIKADEGPKIDAVRLETGANSM